LFSDPDIVSSWIVWSPDGQVLAVPSERGSEQPLLGGQPSPVHLYLVKASTGEIIHEFSNAVLATWSPDGKELAYAYLQGEDYEIYIWNLNENKTRKLLSTSHLWSLEWSPKGDWLAFASGRLEANYVDTRLFLIRPDGSSRLDLTPPGVLAILAGPGMWSPDGRYLLANILTDRVDVGIIDISNGNLIKVTDDKHIDGARSWVWETTR
jgi:Tol biopolymer transport system component